MWEKEKMLVTSIFSFSHNVFKSFLIHGRYKAGLCGKEFNVSQAEDFQNIIEKEIMLDTSIFSFFYNVFYPPLNSFPCI